MLCFNSKALFSKLTALRIYITMKACLLPAMAQTAYSLPVPPTTYSIFHFFGRLCLSSSIPPHFRSPTWFLIQHLLFAQLNLPTIQASNIIVSAISSSCNSNPFYDSVVITFLKGCCWHQWQFSRSGWRCAAHNSCIQARNNYPSLVLWHQYMQWPLSPPRISASTCRSI